MEGEQEKLVVKIADMEVVQGDCGELATYALGSCIGLTVFDPVARVGGLLHFMLPNPSQRTGATKTVEIGPHPYGSSAVPALFRAAYALGAEKDRLIVCAAGGAERLGGENDLRIGARNWAMLRKLLFQNGITLAATDVGGSISRNLKLMLSTGEVNVTSSGDSSRLFPRNAA